MNKDTSCEKEERQWQDLEKKLKPKTVDCRTGVCKYRQRMVKWWSRYITWIHTLKMW